MNRCENYTLSCEARDCSECDMFSWDGTGVNPRRDKHILNVINARTDDDILNIIDAYLSGIENSV